MTLHKLRYYARYYPMVAFNWLQGCRFFWVETPGTPGGGYFDMTEKCCPYPVRFDWSVRACNKAGECGCVKRLAPQPDSLTQEKP